jgi:hypothetical protein
LKNTPFVPVCAFFGLLLLAPVWLVHPQTEESGGLITGLAIYGLKRTKLRTVEAALRQFIGRQADTLDTDEVYAAVLDTGVLEPVSITVKDDENGKILAVTVREKWALFPLPIVFAGSGELNAGLFFVDSNALGLTDKFFLGGIYGSDFWMLTSGYMHTDRKGAPGWMASGAFARSERRDKDQNNMDIRRFNLDSIDALLGISYQFTGIMTARLQLHYHQMTLRESESPLREPETGAIAIGVTALAVWRKSGWDGFLTSEKSLTAGYAFIGGINGPSFSEMRLRGTYQQPIVPGFKFNLGSGLLYQPGVPPLFESAPHAAAVNILPNSFSARHYAGVSGGFEKYLFKISSIGTLSALASYQAVFSDGSILGGRLDHGVAGSVVFYLSRLAIPAMGIGAAYNVRAKYFHFSFSMGMMF